jgi:CDP-glycerol glycerophosphotransferase
MNLEAVKSKVKLIVNVFNRAFSSLFNKNERTVIFGGWFGNRFADNSKALFLFMSQNKKELGLGNVIFTTNNSKICNQLKISGYHTVLTKTVLSFKYHLTAGYHIVDMGGKDLLRITSCNAVRVNL